MTIQFPLSPTTGDTYTFNGVTWLWNGTTWSRSASLNFGPDSGRPDASVPSLYFNTDVDALQLYYPNQNTWDRVSTFTYQQDPTDTTGQIAYTSPGTYSFVCPAGVFQVHVVCIGGGGGGFNSSFGGSGGGGGGLAWRNNIPVTPGNSYTVVVGNRGITSSANTSGSASYFISTDTVAGFGGGAATRTSTGNPGSGGGFFTDLGAGGGGFGGNGGSNPGGSGAGGGGAGGYSGNGGAGGDGNQNGQSGAGGGAGGGGGGSFVNYSYGGSGGGTGLLGIGSSGTGGSSGTAGFQGGGGSGGVGNLGINAQGGAYGGGGAGSDENYLLSGGSGAVRIIWGPNRSFPSTNTGDL
jgi:hypothetical protein